MKNSQFSTNIWSTTAGCSRLITIWKTGLACRTWAADDDDPVGNCMWRKSQKLRRGQIVQKTILPPPLWETPKDIATKTGEIQVRDRALYRHWNFQADRREISGLCLKIHIFLIGTPPGGGLPSHAIHFWKAFVELILSSNWHIRLRLITVLEIFAL